MYKKNPDSVTAARLRFCLACGVALPRNRRVYCADCRPAGYKWSGRSYVVPETAQRTNCQMCGRPLRGGAASQSGRQVDGPTLGTAGAGAAAQSGSQIDGPTGDGTMRDGKPVPYGGDGGPTGDGDGGRKDGLRFCARCLPVYQETAGRIFAETGKVPRAEALRSSGALESLRRRLSRRVQLSGDMIAKVAQIYDSPYNSYGRLRAYIEEFDQLPPDQFLKSQRKHPVVETIRGLE